MRYRLLGSVEVWVGDRLVHGGQPRQRAVLAALLVDAGQVVPSDTLVDRVWGETPPRDARGALRVQIAGVRRTLEHARGANEHAGCAGEQADPANPGRLLRRPGGYLLDVDRDRIDLHRFRALLDGARHRDCPDDHRARLLREALGLWRGWPLTGIAGTWAGWVRDSWLRERLDAVVAWADAELRVGNAGAVLGPVGALAGEHPLVESLTAVLMRALFAAGRPADAVEQYARTRRRLVEELGTDPGPELRAVHQAVLRGDLVVPRARPAALRSVPVAPVVPARLPADTPTFAGRTEYLNRLDGLLAEAGRSATTVVISAVSGAAGVGKTALAVRWAHRVAGEFPDGQLYVNLRGFDPGGASTAPADAVRGFLDALGVPPERIPPGADAQAGLYRSLIAGKRMLVLLDNARDAEHARPLLPGTPTALTVVTSRNQLTGLVAADGAHPLTLDTLSTVEATELLARRLGARRVAGESGAVDRIIAACAGLPLALAVVAARTRQTGFPLATLAAELDEADRRLDALDAGDPTTALRAVFSWSYATLGPAAARLFRLLGPHPGPDASAGAAASLAGRPLPEARRLLAELVRANLLTEHRPGRYALHDLLRAYATDLAHGTDPPERRQAAAARLLDHYTHTAHAADRLLNPSRDAIPLALGAPERHADPEHLSDHRQAMAWLTAEHPALLATIRAAADGGGRDRQVFQLAWALDTFLSRRGHRYDRSAAWLAALAAGRRLADPVARAHAHRRLAHADIHLDRHPTAREHLQRALDLYLRAGDTTGRAHTHHTFENLWHRQGRSDIALDHAQQALTLYRAAGHRRGEADALTRVGRNHALLGSFAEALDHGERGLALHRRLGNAEGQAAAWDCLGLAHHHLGHHARATDCYRRALELARELGNRYDEARALVHLGDARRAAGNLGDTGTAWRDALVILTDLDHPDATTLRIRLHFLDRPGTSRQALGPVSKQGPERGEAQASAGAAPATVE